MKYGFLRLWTTRWNLLYLQGCLIYTLKIFKPNLQKNCFRSNFGQYGPTVQFQQLSYQSDQKMNPTHSIFTTNSHDTNCEKSETIWKHFVWAWNREQAEVFSFIRSLIMSILMRHVHFQSSWQIPLEFFHMTFHFISCLHIISSHDWVNYGLGMESTDPELQNEWLCKLVACFV